MARLQPFNIEYQMQPPCKGCQKRHSGCHSECKPYIEFSEARKRVYEQKRIQRQISFAKADAIAWSQKYATRQFYRNQERLDRQLKKVANKRHGIVKYKEQVDTQKPVRTQNLANSDDSVKGDDAE